MIDDLAALANDMADRGIVGSSSDVIGCRSIDERYKLAESDRVTERRRTVEDRVSELSPWERWRLKGDVGSIQLRLKSPTDFNPAENDRE